MIGPAVVVGGETQKFLAGARESTQPSQLAKAACHFSIVFAGGRWLDRREGLERITIGPKRAREMIGPAVVIGGETQKFLAGVPESTQPSQLAEAACHFSIVFVVGRRLCHREGLEDVTIGHERAPHGKRYQRKGLAVIAVAAVIAGIPLHVRRGDTAECVLPVNPEDHTSQ
jgi:hypothetical protein